MRSLITIAVKRPITTIMCFLSLVIFGLLAATSLGVEFLPYLQVPRLVVSAAYHGLPPREMRDLVTVPIEDGLSSVNGIKNIFSVSRQGLSTLELEFHWGTDMLMAAVETREALDLLYPSLPSDMSKPMVMPINPGDEPILWLGIFSKQGNIPLARRLAEREIKTRLQQVEGVGSLVLVGGVKDEIKVLVDHEKALNKGITVDSIGQIISMSNIDFPAGSFTTGETEYLLKSAGKVRTLAELGDLFVGRNEQGVGIPLSSLARIEPGTKEQVSFFQVDGREGVALLIRRKGGESPIKIAENVRRELSRLEQSYGRDIEFKIVQDSSLLIKNSLENLVCSGLLGAGIAFIILLLFLRRFSTALILISSIPFSILAALLLLRISGSSLNSMSIGGLALGIGMMIDNSVVVLENLQRKISILPGLLSDQIIDATHEMASSSFGSTITSLVVFIPVIFLPGIIGALFADLAKAVCYALVASFVISITLVPVLFLLTLDLRQRHPGPVHGHTALRKPRFLTVIEKNYRAIFRLFMKHPWLLIGCIVFILVTGVVLLPYIRLEFMPQINKAEIRADITFPAGTSLDYIKRASTSLSERVLHNIAGIDSIYTRAGGEDNDLYYLSDPAESSEKLHFVFRIKPAADHLTKNIMAELGLFLQVPRAETVISLPEDIAAPLLGLQDNGTTLLVGGDTEDEAITRSQELMNTLAPCWSPETIDIIPARDKPEIHLLPDREQLARTGLNVMAVTQSLRGALEGIYPSQMKRDGRDIDIRVQLDKKDSLSPAQLEELQIPTTQGNQTRIGDIAVVESAREYASLLRNNRKDIAYLLLQAPDHNVKKADCLLEQTLARHPYVTSQKVSALENNFLYIIFIFILALILLYLVLGAQFQSFYLPLLIMFSFPLSFSGITGSLFLFNKSINFSSALGILTLLGTVVNNAIILFENYKSKIARNIPALLVVYRGSNERLRPILITVLTTICALIPVAIDPFEKSTQSPMAIAVIGGLFFSTLLTLFVLPQVFFRYYRKRHSHHILAGGTDSGDVPAGIMDTGYKK